MCGWQQSFTVAWLQPSQGHKRKDARRCCHVHQDACATAAPQVDLYTTWGKVWQCGGGGQCGTCIVEVSHAGFVPLSPCSATTCTRAVHAHDDGACGIDKPGHRPAWRQPPAQQAGCRMLHLEREASGDGRAARRLGLTAPAVPLTLAHCSRVQGGLRSLHRAPPSPSLPPSLSLGCHMHAGAGGLGAHVGAQQHGEEEAGQCEEPGNAWHAHGRAPLAPSRAHAWSCMHACPHGLQRAGNLPL